jgi:hypothetical protein
MIMIGPVEGILEGLGGIDRSGTGFWRHVYRSLPAQTGANKHHGRQREKDIHSKGKADARQEVGTDGHHGTQVKNRNQLSTILRCVRRSTTRTA